MARLNLQGISSERIEQVLKNIDTRRKILIWVATVTIIIGGFWYFFYKDNERAISRLQRDISESKQRLTKLKEAVAQSKKLQEELTLAQQSLEEILIFLPELREIPGILQSVSEMGARAGLEQLLFEPKKEEVKDFYSVIPISLDLRGSFHSIGLFYDELSQFPRVIRVRSFALEKSDEDSSLLKVKCDIETYRYLTEQQPSEEGSKEMDQSKKKSRKNR